MRVKMLAQIADDFGTELRNGMYGAINIGTAISLVQELREDSDARAK